MNNDGSFVRPDGTTFDIDFPYTLFKVSLIRADSTGVNTLLDGVSCERAFQELISVQKLISADSSHDNTDYLIIDKFNIELALMIPAKSLRCSRNELVQRLCQARELYEFRVEKGVFRPAVEVI